MVRGLLSAALAALLLAVGCGGDEMTPTGPTGYDETAAPLTFTKSGGVAGIDATLTIDADGTVSLRSGHPPSVEEHELEVPAPELDAIESVASSIDYPEGPPPDTGCADCFVYTVSSPTGELTYDDVSLMGAPADARELIGRLNAIVDEVLFPNTEALPGK